MMFPNLGINKKIAISVYYFGLIRQWKNHFIAEYDNRYLLKQNERIYIFSPSIDVDYQTWLPVKKYIKNELKLEETDDEHFFIMNMIPNHYQKSLIRNEK